MRRRHSVAFADFEIKDQKSSLAVSCTMMYGMAHILCGIVLPLADSFVSWKKKVETHTYYLEIFLISQYVTGIIALLYLQVYIFIYERKMKQACQIENDTEFREIVDDFAVRFSGNPNTGHSKIKFQLSTNAENAENGESSRAQTCDNEPTETPVEINTETEDGAMVPYQNNHNESEDNQNQPSQTTPLFIESNKTEELDDDSSSVSSDKENKAYFPFVRDSEGINLYLRLGAVAFGFGVMVHDGFKIADQIRLQTLTCHNILWTPKQCFHFLYIFVQTFFIFKYHRIVFKVQKSLIRLILWHLTIISICQWFKTVVYEINHELIEHKLVDTKKVFETSHQYILNTSNYMKTHNLTCLNQLSYKISPYLFPCAIEYSLICAAILYKMLRKIDEKDEDCKLEELERKQNREISVSNDDEEEAALTNNENEHHTHMGANHLIDHVPAWDIKQKTANNGNIRYSECHRSHKGLFLGLLVLMVTLVHMAIFFSLSKTKATKYFAILFYQWNEIILLVISVIVIVVTFFKMRVLGFRQLSSEEALDDTLLLVGLAGVVVYNLFLVVSSAHSIRSPNVDSLTTLLFLTKSISEIVQAFLQVLFVLEASRKCAKLNIHVQKKPGRSQVVFMIIINLTLWVISIFETKRADNHEIFTKYYQKTSWSIITHCSLPLIIFFRFHSSVCLSDIWIKCYKKRKNLLKPFYQNW